MNENSCVICTERTTNPVVLSDCIHRFCKKCIKLWCRVSSTCPSCRQPIVWLLDSKKKLTQVIPTQNLEEQYTRPGHSTTGLPPGIPPRSPDRDYIQEIDSSSSSAESSRCPNSSSLISKSASSALSSSSSEARDTSPKVTRKELPSLRPRKVPQMAVKARRVSPRKKK